MYKSLIRCILLIIINKRDYVILKFLLIILLFIGKMKILISILEDKVFIIYIIWVI